MNQPARLFRAFRNCWQSWLSRKRKTDEQTNFKPMNRAPSEAGVFSSPETTRGDSHEVKLMNAQPKKYINGSVKHFGQRTNIHFLYKSFKAFTCFDSAAGWIVDFRFLRHPIFDIRFPIFLEQKYG